MLLELLLEEEELSKEAMETLQRAYNLRGQDAEVRPHTHRQTRGETGHHLRSSSVIPSNNKKSFLSLPKTHASAALFLPASVTGSIPTVPPRCVGDSALLNGTAEGFEVYTRVRVCFLV